MGVKGIIAIAFLLLFLSNVMPTGAFAMDAGLSTEKLSLEEQERILSNLGVSTIHSEPERTHAISCFDVNQNGRIALGFEVFEQKQICIYSADGEFEYGYTWESDGSFRLAWDGDYLIIYFIRGSVAASFDQNATCLEIAEIPSTFENSEYLNHVLNATQRIVGDDHYFIRNNMGVLNIFAMSYSQLVRVDRGGTETVIYDVNNRQIAKYITGICVVVAFAAIAMVAIIRQFRLSRK